jgi:hypothetical protein
MDFTTVVNSKYIDTNYSFRNMELDVSNTSTGISQKYTPTIDDEINFSDFTVKWTLEIEAREWGVKGMIIIPTKVTGSMFICEEKGDEIAEYECVLPDSFELKVVDSDNRVLCSEITPQSIEIDFKTKLITVIL